MSSFVICLLILILYSVWVTSEPCVLPNVSYLIRSHGMNSTVQSKVFTRAELLSKCHGNFIKEIFPESCPSLSDLLDQPRKTIAAQNYIYGLLAVSFISILSIVGILACPKFYNVSFKYMLSFFTSVAVGTLFGDTMFHLIPYALNIHSHGQHEKHKSVMFSVPDFVWKMLASVSTFYAFYLLEVALHTYSGGQHDHSVTVSQTGKSLEHKNLHMTPEVGESTPLGINGEIESGQQAEPSVRQNCLQHASTEMNATLQESQGNDNQDDEKSNKTKNGLVCVPCVHLNEAIPNGSPMFHKKKRNSAEPNGCAPASDVVHYTTNNNHNNQRWKHRESFQKLKAIKATGWMVLIGDSIHNFADGLAMGAAFTQDILLGLTTTFAIGLHELPHEFGDYAILIRSGFTHAQAMVLNFLSATTAFVGFFLGATLSVNDRIRQWIFSITIGMFMYIALVDLLPTLLREHKTNLKYFLVVNMGILVGIVIMFLLAIFEDNLIHSSK